MLVKANEEIDEAKVKLIEDAGIDKVRIRSVLTCQTRRGVCVECYGRDLARGRKVNIGEAVGVIAAQSIGEPGTQLTMRTFHIGGAASRRAEQSNLENRNDGVVKLLNVAVAKKKDGTLVVMNRNGELLVTDDQGRERERYGLVYGAKLLVARGPEGRGRHHAGRVGSVRDADPHRGGRPREVRRPRRRRHHAASRSTRSPASRARRSSPRRTRTPGPRISIKDEDGQTRKLANSEADARYMLPVGANIVVHDGDEVDAGDVLAKMPRETTKTKDITGGLPRVAELFEARKPKEHAVISEIDGVVAFGKDTKGKRKVVITPEVDGKLRPDLAKEYLIAKGKHISVHAGDRVRAGEPLMDGAANPHDILRVLGEKELAALAGGRDPGGLPAPGREDQRQAHRDHRPPDAAPRPRRGRGRHQLPGRRAGREVRLRGGERAGDRTRAASRPQAEPLLLGITKASLSTESLHLGLVLPGDHQGAHRGRHQRQGRQPARPQGERHHGPAHPGRHRPARTTSTSTSRWRRRWTPSRRPRRPWRSVVGEE